MLNIFRCSCTAHALSVEHTEWGWEIAVWESSVPRGLDLRHRLRLALRLLRRGSLDGDSVILTDEDAGRLAFALAAAGAIKVDPENGDT